MLNTDELYEGLPREQAAAYRKEAIEKYGREVVEHSENHLRKLTKEGMQVLIAEQKEIGRRLASLKDKEPVSTEVHAVVHLHYLNTRKLWGTDGTVDKQAENYKGLGKLYLTDERITMIDGVPQPELNAFLSVAMAYYADNQLK